MKSGKKLAAATAAAFVSLSIAMPAGACENQTAYDEITQELFQEISQEKLEEYEEEYGEPEEEEIRAFLQTDERLDQAAAERLQEAMEQGYAGGQIQGGSTIQEYLSQIGYPGGRNCMEIYLPDCGDSQEAWEKFSEKMMERYEEKEDRRYLPEYYRKIGMAHADRQESHYFMILMVR